jgi:hypothetical protein
VRVQARLARESLPKSPKKQLDNASAATLLMLAAELGESPLAQALRRLASVRSHTDAVDNSVGSSVANLGHGDEPLEGVEDENPEQ